jgi:uncharacterized protein YdhG (YjbR/CyaY superfamily)
MTVVDEYLAGVPDDSRAALQKLRETIQEAAPEATETISYQMPTFKYRGKSLVGYGAFKNHCSLFPMSMHVIETHEKELQPYRASKGTIHFTPEAPLPAALVKAIVEARIAEIEAKVKP